MASSVSRATQLFQRDVRLFTLGLVDSGQTRDLSLGLDSGWQWKRSSRVALNGSLAMHSCHKHFPKSFLLSTHFSVELNLNHVLRSLSLWHCLSVWALLMLTIYSDSQFFCLGLIWNSNCIHAFQWFLKPTLIKPEENHTLRPIHPLVCVV